MSYIESLYDFLSKRPRGHASLLCILQRNARGKIAVREITSEFKVGIIASLNTGSLKRIF